MAKTEIIFFSTFSICNNEWSGVVGGEGQPSATIMQNKPEWLLDINKLTYPEMSAGAV